MRKFLRVNSTCDLHNLVSKSVSSQVWDQTQLIEYWDRMGCDFVAKCRKGRSICYRLKCLGNMYEHNFKSLNTHR